MKTLTYIFLIINCSFIITNAQPTLEWTRLYPSNLSFNAYGYDFVLDDSSNVYVVGSSDSGSVTSCCVVKYSNSGTQLWVSYFTGSLGVTAIGSIALDDSSNVYVTGFSNNGSTFFDYCTVKFNSNGVLQWFRYYNSIPGGEDAAEKIAVDRAGNIYVSGYSDGPNGFVYTTIKYSPSGQQIWLRNSILSGSGNTHVTGIKVDDSCNVYITGECEIKAVTIKYDSSGSQIWAQDYRAFEGFGGTTGAKDIVLDRYNNVYISGYANQSRSFTIKYFSTGILAWERKYNPDTAAGGRYNANSVAVDTLGNVYASGFCQESQSSRRKIYIIKYSSIGETLWVQKDTGLATQQTYMDIDKSNYIYIAASTSEPGPNNSITIFKYDITGVKIWAVKYFPGGISNPSGLIVDSNNNLYLTGSTGGKMLTIKYSQPLGIINTNNGIPQQYKLYQNYPNPFNPTTNIKFQIANNSHAKLAVYDILGRVIATLVYEDLKAGTYEVNWSAKNCSSGIYLYNLITDTFTETKKMILIK